MSNISKMNPHHSPRLSPSPSSTITDHHPHPFLGIQSSQDSDTPVNPPASPWPENELSDYQSQLSSPNSPSSLVPSLTSSDLAAEEQLTCPFSQSPLTRSPSAEPQSSLNALPFSTALGYWTQATLSSSGTSSESSSPSETDEDMPPKAKSPPKGPSWVKKRFENHRIYQNQEGALDAYPFFKAQLKAIIDPARQSTISPLEYGDVKLTVQKYKYKNKATFLDRLLPFLIKDSRLICIPHGPTDPDQNPTTVTEEEPTDGEKDIVWEDKSFLRSGLITLADTFNNASLPFIYDDPELAEGLEKAIKRDDHLTKPKPDRSYGVDPAHCIFPEGFRIPMHIEKLLQVAEDVYHIFLVVEGKQDQGSELEAVNQACRDGAALVFAARSLRELLGMADVVGADDRTFVFSATISLGLVQIWVHWAEVFPAEQGRRPKFHMDLLASKAIDDEKTFIDLRKILHNILDWGVGKRKDQLQPLHDSIVQYAKDQNDEVKKAPAKAYMDKATALQAAKDFVGGGISSK
ncbi:MAG: hypothetical protein Q9171_001773 [Xanthocarpia ochracea]